MIVIQDHEVDVLLKRIYHFISELVCAKITNELCKIEIALVNFLGVVNKLNKAVSNEWVISEHSEHTFVA